MILINLYLTETVNSESSTIKVNLDKIPSVIQENFELTSSVVEKTISHFKELKDIYG